MTSSILARSNNGIISVTLVSWVYISITRLKMMGGGWMSSNACLAFQPVSVEEVLYLGQDWLVEIPILPICRGLRQWFLRRLCLLHQLRLRRWTLFGINETPLNQQRNDLYLLSRSNAFSVCPPLPLPPLFLFLSSHILLCGTFLFILPHPSPSFWYNSANAYSAIHRIAKIIHYDNICTNWDPHKCEIRKGFY